MFLQLLTGLSLLEIVLGVFCNETLTDSTGSLSSPEDDIILSSKNLHCQYDIYVGAGNAVMLRWTKFELNGKMPSCLENYVEIFIGCGRHSIGRYCSDHRGCGLRSCSQFTVYSPDPCLRIIYHTSDSYDGKGGISAYYEAISISTGRGARKFSRHGTSFYSPGWCSRDGSAREVEYTDILSPKWPLRSPPSQDCYYRIQPKKSSQKTFRIIFMHFNMSYDDGCHNNTVIVKGGAKSKPYSALTAINGPICGNKKPFYLTVTAERVWIRFNSRDGARFAIGIVAYDKSLSAGAVAGIVVSIAVFLAFVGCLFVYLRRRRRRARQQAEQGQATAAAREEVIRRAAAHHPPPSATRAARNASPRPQQSNIPSSKRKGEQQQTTEATARAVAHHPPPSAPPPPANGSPLPQQSNAPPPEPDYAPPSYIEVMAKQDKW